MALPEPRVGPVFEKLKRDVLDLLDRHPDGLPSHDIRRRLHCDPGAVPHALKALLRTGEVTERVELHAAYARGGQCRVTRIFMTCGPAAGPTTGGDSCS